MKKQFLSIALISFLSLCIISCGSDSTDNTNQTSDNTEPNSKTEDDSKLLAQKATEDSINEILKNIKVRIYIRTGVYYDSDGFAMDEGRLKEDKGFSETKEYQLKGMDELEKIVVEGNCDKISIICLEGDKELYNSKEITLDVKKTFKGSGPNGGSGLNWLYAGNRSNDFKIKVLYKNERNVFEGIIHPRK